MSEFHLIKLKFLPFYLVNPPKWETYYIRGKSHSYPTNQRISPHTARVHDSFKIKIILL